MTALAAMSLMAATSAAEAVLENACGRLAVRPAGARVVSWRPAALKGGEAFFLADGDKPPHDDGRAGAPRPQNDADDAPHWGRESHGGIPLCWPWFGAAATAGLPKHGLVRYMKWERADAVGADALSFRCVSTPESRKLWPHDFELTVTYRLAASDALAVSVTAKNTGGDAFASQLALHPYFAVADAANAAVDGSRLPVPWTLLQFEADGKAHTLAADGRTISVTAADATRWAVWNPGRTRIGFCAGLSADDWRRFYCLEPVIEEPPLSPGETRTRNFLFKIEVPPAGG